MIDIEKLKTYCQIPTERFFEIYECKDERYIFIDQGADILGVCHLDYIPLSNHFRVVELDGLYIFSPRLDDRLGVYLLLEVIPTLISCKYDILLTVDEESGNSSAKDFIPPRDYNWTFELDRAGIDAVTYRLDSLKFDEAIRNAGIKKGFGSYSDIADIEGNECRVNFGIGYHDQHTNTSHAKLKDVIKACRKISNFIEDNHDIKYPRDVAKVYRTNYGHYYQPYYKNDLCDICYQPYTKGKARYIDGMIICEDCARIYNT